jgi:hypothetical protein
VKRPKWLGESSLTKAENLKKVRKQTDQRMRQQIAENDSRGIIRPDVISIRAVSCKGRRMPSSRPESARC